MPKFKKYLYWECFGFTHLVASDNPIPSVFFGTAVVVLGMSERINALLISSTVS